MQHEPTMSLNNKDLLNKINVLIGLPRQTNIIFSLGLAHNQDKISSNKNLQFCPHTRPKVLKKIEREREGGDGKRRVR